MNVRPDIAHVLSDMRALRNQAMQKDVLPKDTIEPFKQEIQENFSDVFKNSINQVNALQKDSAALKTAFQNEDPNVDIVQVMVASEKASVATTGMIQIRNKFVDAYRDIMNMPI